MQGHELEVRRLQANELRTALAALYEAQASGDCGGGCRNLEKEKDILQAAVRSADFVIACAAELQRPAAANYEMGSGSLSSHLNTLTYA